MKYLVHRGLFWYVILWSGRVELLYSQQISSGVGNACPSIGFVIDLFLLIFSICFSVSIYKEWPYSETQNLKEFKADLKVPFYLNAV